MKGSRINTITFIGSGNLATNLALAMHAKGFRIIQVYDRELKRARILAKRVSSKGISTLSGLSQKAELFIISVSDNSLKEVAAEVRVGEKWVVHTSGSVAMNVLKNSSANYGVLYPLQTFTKEHPRDFAGVPVCVEANRSDNTDIIRKVALSLTKNVHVVNSEERQLYHLAAVLSGNFSNFMYVIAEELLKEHGLDFALIRPIIRQTAANAESGDLFRHQTGPAVREDAEIMNRHLGLLRDRPEYRKIYQLISESIIKHKHHGNEL
jgi:predicted short-subunit dehydrogenase-like oxidoreductase (DUF2520 family)